MKIKKILFSFGLLVSLTANATIITSQGNDIRNTGVHLEDGYSITVQAGTASGSGTVPQHLLDAGFSGDFMRTWNTEAVFTLSQINGELFDVASLDVGNYNNNNGGVSAWTLKGYNGAVETFSLVNLAYLGNVELNWWDLTSLTIQNSKVHSSSFDNIELFDSSTQNSVRVHIPEPAPLAIFSLAGIVLFTRKKKLNAIITK